MLPDYPELKAELLRQLSHRAKAIAQDEPAMAGIPANQVHEGRKVLMIREDGTTETIAFDVPLSAEATLSIDDIRRKGPRASIEAIEKIGNDLQGELATRFYAKIGEAAASAGNSLDAKGTALTPEKVLEMMDTMELSFDDDGTWSPPRFVTGPDLSAKGEAAVRAVNEDATYRVRRDEIVSRQREEWRVREACRRLVD